MARRKTVSVRDLVIHANGKLKLKDLSNDEKHGIICFIDHILHQTGNYSGFGYNENYDAENWNQTKEMSRHYYLKYQ